MTTAAKTTVRLAATGAGPDPGGARPAPTPPDHVLLGPAVRAPPEGAPGRRSSLSPLPSVFFECYRHRHRHRRRRLGNLAPGSLLVSLLAAFLFLVSAVFSSPIYSDAPPHLLASRLLQAKLSPKLFSAAPPPRNVRQRRSLPVGSAGTVATNSGLVQGKLTQLPNTNIEVYEFLGVPFAEPPIGVRRFRKPVAKQPWKDILDATARPKSCPQLADTLFGMFEGATQWNANTDLSEDCLYLNIWVPRRVLDDLNQRGTRGKEQNGLHPVFVWIFGGGFTAGTATLDLYDGAILAGYNNIIVVSMQYRLGALGYLYFGVEDAPGNMGMWDQVMALKWTCENIHSFGGDCRNTTIFGESAGAASVSLHLLSPHSRPYFQRAIMQSASALSSWAVLTHDEAVWRSDVLVSKFVSKCPPAPEPKPQSRKRQLEQTQWKVDCLRRQPFIELPNEEWNVVSSEPAGYAQFPFVPVIDGDFLPRDPREMLADGQYYNVSILSGFNQNEGSYFMLYTTKGYTLFKHPDALNKDMNFSASVYRELVREFFAYYPHFNSTASRIVIDAIEFQYTPWRLPVITSQDIINAVDAATGDWAFACPVVSWADSYVELPPAPLLPPPGPPEPLPELMDSGKTEVKLVEDQGADPSSVRYVRLKRANGFSYLKPGEGKDPNGGGPAAKPEAIRNPDSGASQSSKSTHKVFLYYFAQRSTVHPWPEWMGVLHGDEIHFIFGQSLNYSKPYTDEERMLTRFMMAYWSNFAKFGDPNVYDATSPNQEGLNLPPWPEYTFKDKFFLELSVDALVTKRQPSVDNSIKAQECAFWHGYLPRLHKSTGNPQAMQARAMDNGLSRSSGSPLRHSATDHCSSFIFLNNNCFIKHLLLLLTNNHVSLCVAVSSAVLLFVR